MPRRRQDSRSRGSNLASFTNTLIMLKPSSNTEITNLPQLIIHEPSAAGSGPSKG